MPNTASPPLAMPELNTTASPAAPHNRAMMRKPLGPWLESSMVDSTAVTSGDGPNTIAIQPEGPNRAPQ